MSEALKKAKETAAADVFQWSPAMAESTQRLLERLVAGEEMAAPELFDLEFWRGIARAEGLHVCEDANSSGAPSPAAAAIAGVLLGHAVALMVADFLVPRCFTLDTHSIGADATQTNEIRDVEGVT